MAGHEEGDDFGDDDWSLSRAEEGRPASESVVEGGEGKLAVNTGIPEEQLKIIKENFLGILESLKKVNDHSKIAQMAQSWAEMSLWKKLAIGVVLVVPPLAIGILTQGILLITLGLLNLVLYAGSYYLLEDHYANSTPDQTKLDNAAKAAELYDQGTRILYGVADSFQKRIDFFADRLTHFSEGLGEFDSQNVRLEGQGDRLGTLLESFGESAQELVANNEVLKQQLAELSRQVQSLGQSAAKSEALAGQQAAQLESLQAMAVALETSRATFEQEAKLWRDVVTSNSSSVDKTGQQQILDQFLIDAQRTFARAQQGLTASIDQLGAMERAVTAKLEEFNRKVEEDIALRKKESRARQRIEENCETTQVFTGLGRFSAFAAHQKNDSRKEDSYRVGEYPEGSKFLM